MIIQIWGKPGCPHCDSAKRLCEMRQLDYEYKQLGEDFQREDVIAEFPEARTFPQIVVNGQKIGGFEQFVEYVKQAA